MTKNCSFSEPFVQRTIVYQIKLPLQISNLSTPQFVLLGPHQIPNSVGGCGIKPINSFLQSIFSIKRGRCLKDYIQRRGGEWSGPTHIEMLKAGKFLALLYKRFGRNSHLSILNFISINLIYPFRFFGLGQNSHFDNISFWRCPSCLTFARIWRKSLKFQNAIKVWCNFELKRTSNGSVIRAPNK